MRLAMADSTVRWMTDRESGQTILQCLSEVHSDAVVDALRLNDALAVNVGAPQVAYREMITKAQTIDYTHKKLTGGSGQFARVKIAFEPCGWNEGFVFINDPSNEGVPERFVGSVEKGLLLQKDTGLLAGFPLLGLKATLLDGAYHDMDSNALTFEIAARAAFRQLADVAEPILIEPIMTCVVETPDECRQAVEGDLVRRRGRIETSSEGSAAITARVPLSNLFGYAADLRRMTQGSGSHTLSLWRYGPVPPMPDRDPTLPPVASALRVA